jgi:hypothetical protein
MAIQRRYQPVAGALNDLVDVLYQLLADTGDHEQSVTSSVGAGTDIAASKEAT